MNRIVSLCFLLLFVAACASSSPMTSTATVPAAGWDLANLDHERVDHWVEQFTRGEKRDEFETSLERMGRYESMIRRKLRERRMPEDLIYLAFIESGFNPQAHSAAGARGIWQLVPDTARRYGLQVNETVDDRLEPEGSTDAALSYLSDLYERFGSWYLAVAAYNTGENRVGRIMVERTGSERGTDADYYRIWEALPGETRDFVPVMIAAARVVKQRT
jgi:membrane-bound lytic murein transglycosylase D